MSPWYYKNEIIEDNMIPEGALGFLYTITRKSDGKSYIGKKLLWFKKTSVKTVTLKNGTKKKKKITTLVPSDWKTYWGSSANVQKAVDEEGESAFRRDILMFCRSKGSLSYYEARMQMDLRVLEHPELYWNGIVNCRVSSSHIKPPL